MMKNNAIYRYFLFGMILTFNASANEPAFILETDWLEFEVGSTGGSLGAKVVNIKPSGENGVTTLELSLPVDNPQDIDSIEIISRTNGETVKQKKKPVWIEDYENDNHGLRLFLKDKPGIEFRLRLIDDKRE